MPQKSTATDPMTILPFAGLSLLLAEMQALSQIMPHNAQPQDVTDAARAKYDAACEAEFDNMPV